MLWCNFSSLVFIRIRMDIFGIQDQDPHKNLCGSKTLLFSQPAMTVYCFMRTTTGSIDK